MAFSGGKLSTVVMIDVIVLLMAVLEKNSQARKAPLDSKNRQE